MASRFKKTARRSRPAPAKGSKHRHRSRRPSVWTSQGARFGQCGGRMLASAGCTLSSYTVAGKRYPRVKWGDGPADPRDLAAGDRCGDCGCLPGHQHHVGCDIETCPKCGGQAMMCLCFAAQKARAREAGKRYRAADIARAGGGKARVSRSRSKKPVRLGPRGTRRGVKKPVLSGRRAARTRARRSI